MPEGYYDDWGEYRWDSYQVSAGTSGYYTNPGQPYIAPSSGSSWGADTKATLKGTNYTFPGSYGSTAVSPTVESAWLASGQSACGSALSASSDGNYLAVGSPLNYQTNSNAGSVAVYKKSGDKWQFQAFVSANGGEVANAKFGSAVALNSDGTILAVATASTAASPAVEIYTRSGTTWSFLVKLTDTNGALGGGKECMAFASDNTLFVGNPTRDSSTGAVLVYAKGSSYTLSTTLVPSSGTGGKFGYSVSCSLDGKTLAVGSPFSSPSPLTNSGEVRLFSKSVAGVWSETATIRPSDKASNDWFGVSVSLSGTGRVLLVGASSDQTVTDNPRAVVFRYEGLGWVEKKIIKGSGSTLDDGFGWSVKLSQDGTTAYIGAPFPGAGNVNGSRVYIFK